jgi:hypothetical protein
MTGLFRSRLLLPVMTLLAAGMLGGCVVYPAYPTYGYGPPGPYYGGGSYVAVGGGGWRGGGGWHGGGWYR